MHVICMYVRTYVCMYVCMYTGDRDGEHVKEEKRAPEEEDASLSPTTQNKQNKHKNIYTLKIRPHVASTPTTHIPLSIGLGFRVTLSHKS
jgi:hypothetical protein